MVCVCVCCWLALVQTVIYVSHFSIAVGLCSHWSFRKRKSHIPLRQIQAIKLQIHFSETLNMTEKLNDCEILGMYDCNQQYRQYWSRKESVRFHF